MREKKEHEQERDGGEGGKKKVSKWNWEEPERGGACTWHRGLPDVCS